ncbi:MAG: NAD-dependent protein deacylase [Clostridia bacterium]|nr:NAD-dependent protein deacylase [Clostridia bacterium]
MTDIERLQQLIDASKRIVFFGGAGVSTESGIKDFRSVDGLYSQKYKYPPEMILHADFFWNKTKDFYDFYREKMICDSARPNAAHKKLAELERAGKLSCVITQNIDGLHTEAGSERVYELHGSVHRNRCTRCNRPYSLEHIKASGGVPVCACGGIVKPDVVLYGEQLDSDTLDGAIRAISDSDLLIVGGTSLTVYPAAGLISYYGGKELVLINRDVTQYDSEATLIIREPIGKTLEMIKVEPVER